MPQFDFFSFFVQIFWLCIFSCTFYLLYLKFPVAKSAEAIKIRGKLLSLKSSNNKTNQFDIPSNAKAFGASIIRSIYKFFK